MIRNFIDSKSTFLFYKNSGASRARNYILFFWMSGQSNFLLEQVRRRVFIKRNFAIIWYVARYWPKDVHFEIIQATSISFESFFFISAEIAAGCIFKHEYVSGDDFLPLVLKKFITLKDSYTLFFESDKIGLSNIPIILHC